MAEKTIDRTILYLTDNAGMDDEMLEKFRNLILKASGDIPIVSVSQKPISNFGTNICVGEIGRSGTSMEYQFIIGLRAIDTKWTVVAEHDCIYSSEHFNWTPPDDTHFWYNDNVWLCQLRHDDPVKHVYNGMFSLIRHRRVQSQLIADTVLLKEASEKRYGIEIDPAWKLKYPLGRMGEPGSANFKHTTRLLRDPAIRHLRKQVKEYLTGYNGREFKTRIPNIDVRHGGNLTGHRRGNFRRFTLPPWGTLEDVLGSV